jgi:hypothetical protein
MFFQPCWTCGGNVTTVPGGASNSSSPHRRFLRVIAHVVNLPEALAGRPRSGTSTRGNRSRRRPRRRRSARYRMPGPGRSPVPVAASSQPGDLLKLPPLAVLGHDLLIMGLGLGILPIVENTNPASQMSVVMRSPWKRNGGSRPSSQQPAGHLSGIDASSVARILHPPD